VEQLERGQSLRFGGLAGSFDRFEGGRIYFRVGEVTMARAVSELRPTELAALVPGAGEDAQFRVNFGLFLIAEKEYATARGVIGAAAKKGIDVTDARDLLNRFAPRPCPACDGEKDVPCGACNGTGNTGKRAKTCPKCNGRRGGPCAVCRAVGAVRCDRCGGSGRLMGGFNCLNCVRGRIKCSRCGGDGRAGCRTCRGRGVLASTSACPTCAGKKRVPCRRCNGQGELPPLEAGPAPPAASP